MSIKERAQFLIDRYDDKSIEIVNDLLKEVDERDLKYWNEVLKTCQEILKNKNNSYALL
jgi:hypothetical protein